ncbi:hypothetical protein D3C81_1784590 [compost metagenome]
MNAVYDRSRAEISKNDVTVPTHELYDDLFGKYVTKLISSLDVYVNNSFHAYLRNAFNGPSLTMLPHKHAEHGGFRRINAVSFGKMHPRIRRISREQQLAAATCAAQVKN